MDTATFKQAVCSQHGISEGHYAAFVLRRCVFRRVRLIVPIISLFYPDFLFHERRLIDSVGKCGNLREVREEIDFYQHKYVVNHVFKDALRFRVSGMRLMGLANIAFRESINQHEGPDDS